MFGGPSLSTFSLAHYHIAPGMLLNTPNQHISTPQMCSPDQVNAYRHSAHRDELLLSHGWSLRKALRSNPLQLQDTSSPPHLPLDQIPTPAQTLAQRTQRKYTEIARLSSTHPRRRELPHNARDHRKHQLELSSAPCRRACRCACGCGCFFPWTRVRRVKAHSAASEMPTDADTWILAWTPMAIPASNSRFTIPIAACFGLLGSRRLQCNAPHGTALHASRRPHTDIPSSPWPVRTTASRHGMAYPTIPHSSLQCPLPPIRGYCTHRQPSLSHAPRTAFPAPTHQHAPVHPDGAPAQPPSHPPQRAGQSHPSRSHSLRGIPPRLVSYVSISHPASHILPECAWQHTPNRAQPSPAELAH
jgi:hypothetical protein